MALLQLQAIATIDPRGKRRGGGSRGRGHFIATWVPVLVLCILLLRYHPIFAVCRFTGNTTHVENYRQRFNRGSKGGEHDQGVKEDVKKHSERLMFYSPRLCPVHHIVHR